MIDRITEAFVSEFLGGASGDREQRLRARWLVRVIVSFLALPAARLIRGGKPFPSLPGHWLLLSNGVIAVLLCVSILMTRKSPPAEWRLIVYAVSTGIPSAVYLGGAVAAGGGGRWTVVLSVLGTLHLVQGAGRNNHHVLEAAFKALGLALRRAVENDSRRSGVASTKGTLSK